MTDTPRSPRTEAGRRLLPVIENMADAAGPAWSPAEGSLRLAILAIEDEARREVVEQIREAPTIAAQHTCWDDHEGGPNGPHADGSPCTDRVAWEAIDRQALIAALASRTHSTEPDA